MYDRIRTYLSEQLDIPVEEMSRDTTFDSLHLDSLDMVEMMMDMEEELGVDFDLEGETDITTIGALADYIDDKLAGLDQ